MVLAEHAGVLSAFFVRCAQVEMAIACLPPRRQKEHMAHFWTALQREVAVRKCATITVSLERVFRKGPLVAAAKERNTKDPCPLPLGGQPRGNVEHSGQEPQRRPAVQAHRQGMPRLKEHQSTILQEICRAQVSFRPPQQPGLPLATSCGSWRRSGQECQRQGSNRGGRGKRALQRRALVEAHREVE
eukprot:6214373-Pleurochrysis_carterae.AAC.3